MYCIYRVTNNINGKTYIGQHKYTNEDDPLFGYKGSGTALLHAYKKYGFENFSMEVLYKRIQYKDTVNSMEIWMIEKERKENKNGCYNITDGGDGCSFWTGKHRSRKDREKISNTLKGRPWSGHHTEESRRKISEAMKGNKYHLGIPCSEETKKKISKANKGRKGSSHFSILNKERIGKPLSEKHRQKISESNKGRNTWARGSHWYNNGIIQTQARECPEGFVPGRLYRRRKSCK